MASKVYFTDFRANHRENLQQKLARLVKQAGILDNIDFHNKYTAIKIHFGEPGNLSYLRPNYAKVIVDLIKEQGGRVFLTDCNTLYVGRRKNGLDHLDAAYENGFNPFTLGCHVVIADGIKGTDEVWVPVDGEYVKTLDGNFPNGWGTSLHSDEVYVSDESAMHTIEIRKAEDSTGDLFTIVALLIS